MDDCNWKKESLLMPLHEPSYSANLYLNGLGATNYSIAPSNPDELVLTSSGDLVPTPVTPQGPIKQPLSGFGKYLLYGGIAYGIAYMLFFRRR